MTVQVKPPPMPRLYAKQRAAIFAPQRYSFIEASTKAGKTAGCLVWLLTHAWNDGTSGRNYWWVAPIFPQAKIAFNRLKRMLAGSDPQQRVWRANETELWIELANGGRCWFKGADKPDSLYGEDVYAAVIDEASRCKEEAWHAVRSTLTATAGPVRIIGNVRGRRNWAYLLGQRAKAGEPGLAYHKLTAFDAVAAGVLPAAEIEDARRTLPEQVFRELYLAEPSDDGGNPFGLAAIAQCVRPLSGNPPAAWGVDLAKSHDWTVACGLDDAGHCCRLERWQADWGQTRTRLIDMLGSVPALVDSTGVGDPIVEDLCRTAWTVEGFKFSSTSKQQLMEGLASDIQRGEAGFPDGWLRSELEAFEFAYYAGGVRYSAPEGLHDDGVCALALSRQKWRDLQSGRLSFSARPVEVFRN
jgi:hypothetical protein